MTYAPPPAGPRGPATVVSRLAAWTRARPVAAPVVAGAAARLVAATWGAGMHARDDYFHVLAPAGRWLEDPTYDWDASADPGAGIRSHLLPRIVWLLLRAARGLGLDEPDHALVLVSGVLGLASLLVIPGLYHAGRRWAGAECGRWAAWLGALHFAMPYAGTRLLLGGVAMPAVAWALAWAASDRRRDLLAAGAAFGLAFWLRYPTAVAAAAALGVLCIGSLRRGGPKKAVATAGWFCLGAGLLVLVQGAFDVVTGGTFLGPIRSNVDANLCSAGLDGACRAIEAAGGNPHRALTRSSPWTYAGTLLALTLPPATVVVAPAMLRAARAMPVVAASLLAFVIAHSLVPHKEERFLLPLLPAFLLLLAAVPGAVRTGLPMRAERAWPWVRRWLVGVHGMLLAIALSAQPQANNREATRALRHDPGARAVVSLGPEVLPFFLKRPDLVTRALGRPEPLAFGRALREVPDANRFLGFAPDRDRIAILLQAQGLVCDEPDTFEGFWADRLAHRLNPRHNRRRAPVLLWRCERPRLASRAGDGDAPRAPSSSARCDGASEKPCL